MTYRRVSANKPLDWVASILTYELKLSESVANSILSRLGTDMIAEGLRRLEIQVSRSEDGKGIHLVFGPRNWQFDADTGGQIFCGTFL
jgi:hypothetical protein